MLAFVKERLVIINVSKCASTSMHSLLHPQADIVIGGSPKLKHLNFRKSFGMLEFLLSGKIDIREFEFVSLFRNPVDWLYSWYCYRSRAELKNPLHPNYSNRVTDGMSFESFCSAYLQESKKPRCVPGSHQFDLISDDDGLLGVDKCFSFHALGFFESWLSDRLKMKLSFPAKNSSKSFGSRDLSDETLAEFSSKYPKDFRLFKKLAIDPVVLKEDFNSEEHVITDSSYIT